RAGDRRGHRRALLALRCHRIAGAGMVAMGGVLRTTPGRAPGMGLQWPAGGPSDRLVEPELALGGTGQAAGHEAQPQPGRPSLRHGNAAARHRRRTWPQSAAGDRLPALAAGAAAAADTGRRARTASAALVAVRPGRRLEPGP